MAPVDITKDAIFPTPDETVLTLLGTRACKEHTEYLMHRVFPDRSYVAIPGGSDNPSWASCLAAGYRVLNKEENIVLALIMHAFQDFADPTWWKTEDACDEERFSNAG